MDKLAQLAKALHQSGYWESTPTKIQTTTQITKHDLETTETTDHTSNNACNNTDGITAHNKENMSEKGHNTVMVLQEKNDAHISGM